MKVTDPIKTRREIQLFKNYYLEKGEIRNYTLVVVGLNTALRISDLLSLKWGDVYKFGDGFNKYLDIREQKTRKQAKVLLNENSVSALRMLFDSVGNFDNDTYLFQSRKGLNSPITREQAYKIIKTAAEDLGIEGNIGCHSLRKTFGYQAWKNNVNPALIMEVFNHSKFEITKRYLCIAQEDKDDVFRNINY